MRIPRVPSDRDRSDLIYTANHVRGQAVAGEDFATLAKTYSEGHTASVGGETGFLGDSQRDPAVMKAVASLKKGEISHPVPTDDGVYLVQLIDSKKENGETKYNMREIYMKLTPGAETVDSLSAVARDVEEKAVNDGDLAAAAATHGLEVTTTTPFAKNMPIPGVGFAPGLSRFGFAADVGAVSNVIADDNNFYVCKLTQRLPAAASPLEDVADIIKKSLIRDRRLTAATHKAEAFRRSAVAPDTPFEKVASQYGFTVVTTDSFTVSDPVAGQPAYSAFARAAFAINPGNVGGPVESGNSVFVIRVDARTDPDPAAFKERAPQIRDRLVRERVQNYVGYWYDNLRKKATIEDLREAS